MAKTVQILLTDDLDGQAAVETVTFALDGTAFEIDLNAKNATALRNAFGPYVAAGRKTARTSGNSRSGSARARDYDPKAVRAWAASNKVDLPARGRIPAGVLEQFRSAGN